MQSDPGASLGPAPPLYTSTTHPFTAAYDEHEVHSTGTARAGVYPTLDAKDAVTMEAERPTSHSQQGLWGAARDWIWSLEVISMVFATVCVAAIVVILYHISDRPLQDWQLPIEPNSLVSVCSTLARTALMIPIASVISQMKWIWFEEPQNLGHFQAFDSASRGPWGAFTLIFKTKGKAWIAKVGCILTIASLAFEPTAQQVISFDTREVVATNATAVLSVATNWTSRALENDDSPERQIALQSTLLGAVNLQTRDIVPNFQCTGSFCLWETVETLAACTACTTGPLPASRLQRIGAFNFTAVPPTNFSVGPALKDNQFPNVTIQPQVLTFTSAANTLGTAVDASFLAFGAVNYAELQNKSENTTQWVWKDDAKVNYTLCRMHPCIHRFKNVTVRNGVYDQGNLTKVWLIPGTAGANSDPSFRYHADEAGAALDWTVDFPSAMTLNAFLGTMLSGSVPRVRRSLTFAEEATFGAAIIRVLGENPPGQILGSFADVLSAQMRHDDNSAVQNMAGVAMEPQIFVVVDWFWMICPLLILLVTAVMLAIAIVRSAARPLLYKDSAVALLFLGLKTRDAAGRSSTEETVKQRHTALQAENAASRLTAKLDVDANGEYKFIRN